LQGLGLVQSQIASLVEKELARIADPVLVTAIQSLLVTPYPVERDWDYGLPGQSYKCWTVLEHRASDTGIAYCESGFGPSYPWGVVGLSGKYMSMGPDSGWYATLEDAMRESRAWNQPNPPGYEVQ
jgi:hypothetical protein